MNPGDYVDSIFGTPAREPGNRWAFTYYSPRPLPRRLDLPLTVISEMSQADAALGTLAGLGSIITDPAALIGPYLTREAVASSRIEGTQASISDVLQSQLSSPDSASETRDIAEVNAYLNATKKADKLLETLPISSRFLLQVHRALLADVRGSEKNPGEFRQSPVWVGRAGATPDTADFVPPLPDELPDLITDWEKFVNDPHPQLPTLIRAALMHYQFETIHPFLDGNGRMGRLLINIMLKNDGRLPYPLLYLSNYFETHRTDYYSHLQGVRERGDIDGWLSFFMQAVTAQSQDAVKRAHKLVDTRERYRSEASGQRSTLANLADILVTNPWVSTRSVADALGLSEQGARNLIHRAEELGWLTPSGTHGRGGRMHWVAEEIMETLEAPMDYA